MAGPDTDTLQKPRGASGEPNGMRVVCIGETMMMFAPLGQQTGCGPFGSGSGARRDSPKGAATRPINTEHHIGVVPGSFAENLTVAGLDLLTLKLADQLQVGPALLEVVQIGKPPEVARTYSFRGVSVLPHKGIFCRVERSHPCGYLSRYASGFFAKDR
jgi:hypothetical protein